MLERLWGERTLPHMHLTSFLLRVGLAIIFLYHGYLKLVVREYGGWSDTLPETTQVAVAWGETLCGAALLVGFMSRVAAAGITAIMVGAIALQTGKLGFVNIEYLPKGKGVADQIPVGAEYNFAVIVMCLAVIALGSGKVSLDYLIFERRRGQQPPKP